VRVQSPLTDAVPSYHIVHVGAVVDCLFGRCEAPGLAIRLSVDRPGSWWTGCLTEKHGFTRVNLSDARLIMAIMNVLTEESISQSVIRQIPLLEFVFARRAWAYVVMYCHVRH
jgi:hypothetical protein